MEPPVMLNCSLGLCQQTIEQSLQQNASLYEVFERIELDSASNATQYYVESMILRNSVPVTSSTLLTVTSDVISSSPPWAMSPLVQTLWSLAFAVILLVAIGGNAIVMWIVIAHRRMRTVTNYFLVNLSLADLLMSSLNCLFNFIYMLKCDWIFGDWYCTVNNFIANVTVAASIFTLTGISFDRYMAIVRPLEPRMSKKCSLLAITAVWMAGMILAIPCLMYSKTVVYNKKYKLTACILVWPDGTADVSKMDCIYQVVIFVVTYALPILAMSRCYLAMGRELWGSRSIGEFTQRQADAITRKRKVVRMFAAVVSIFAICWFPYQLYFILMHIDNSLMYWEYTQQMYLLFYWLAMGNAVVNPLIYYWMNTRFRAYFKRAICCWWLCLRHKSSEVTNMGSPMVLGRAHSYSHSKSAGDTTLHGNGHLLRRSPPSERFYLHRTMRHSRAQNNHQNNQENKITIKTTNDTLQTVL